MAKQKVPSSVKKLFITLGVIFLVVFIGVAAYMLGVREMIMKNMREPEPVAQKPTKTVTIEGIIDCLPHKGDGPSTLECTYGLREDDDFYILKGLNQEDIMNNTIAVGNEYTVQGAFYPGKNEMYDVVGTITVTEISPL